MYEAIREKNLALHHIALKEQISKNVEQRQATASKEKEIEKIRSDYASLLLQKEKEERDQRLKNIKETSQKYIKYSIQRKEEEKQQQKKQMELAREQAQFAQEKYNVYLNSCTKEKIAKRQELAFKLQQQMNDKKIGL